MAYFFRMGAEQGTSLNSFYLCLALLIGIYIIFKINPNNTVINFMLGFGLFFQLLLLLWYFQDFGLFMQEGLPLYHCRIVTFTLAITWWMKNKRYSRILAFLGFIGSVVAFLIPDASPYAWPHVTVLTFVGYHLNLALLSINILRRTSEIKLKLSDIIIFAFLMNAFIFAVDLILDANYGYLMSLPTSINITVHPIILYVGISLLISLAIYLGEFLIDLLPKRRNLIETK